MPSHNHGSIDTRPDTLTGIRSTTSDYEGWLGKRIPLVARDVGSKHEAMRQSPFMFLRATYYRWAQVWAAECPELARGPVVTSVGDLHIENFGTWRDDEGRLAWGVNDFDEASPLPYTNDLLRLATSAFLAIREGSLGLTEKEVCAGLLQGYRESLERAGAAVVLAERHRKLGERIVECLIEPRRFWVEQLGEGSVRRAKPSASCRAALVGALPRGTTGVLIRARVAGLGSLGRPRFVAIAEWAGGRVAREAKAIAPSGAFWASGTEPPVPWSLHSSQLLAGAVRSRDTSVSFSGSWIVRRLAPDSHKVRFASLGDLDLEAQLVDLMGRDVANVHLATRGAARAILGHLGKQQRAWLRHAAEAMLRRIKEDYGAWLGRTDPAAPFRNH